MWSTDTSIFICEQPARTNCRSSSELLGRLFTSCEQSSSRMVLWNRSWLRMSNARSMISSRNGCLPAKSEDKSSSVNYETQLLSISWQKRSALPWTLKRIREKIVQSMEMSENAVTNEPSKSTETMRRHCHSWPCSVGCLTFLLSAEHALEWEDATSTHTHRLVCPLLYTNSERKTYAERRSSIFMSHWQSSTEE